MLNKQKNKVTFSSSNVFSSVMIDYKTAWTFVFLLWSAAHVTWVHNDLVQKHSHVFLISRQSVNELINANKTKFSCNFLLCCHWLIWKTTYCYDNQFDSTVISSVLCFIVSHVLISCWWHQKSHMTSQFCCQSLNQLLTGRPAYSALLLLPLVRIHLWNHP